MTFLSDSDVKEATRGASFRSRNWITAAYNNGFLDLMVEALLSSRKVSTSQEAISQLLDWHKRLIPSNKVNWTDFTGGDTNSNLMRKLSEIITGEKIVALHDKTRAYGSTSHKVIPEMFLGKLIDLDDKYVKKKLVGVQSQMFHNGVDYPLLIQQLPRVKKSTRGRMLETLIDRIEEQWKEISEDRKKKILPFQSTHFKKFAENMQVIFAEHFEKIWGKMGFGEEYLVSLTLMTWARCLIMYRDMAKFTNVSKMVFFYEVPLLPAVAEYDVGLGKLDALSVVAIDRAPLTSEQMKKIQTLVSRRRFPSVGHVIQEVLNTFPGSHITFKVTDWKFAVGDGPSSMLSKLNIIEVEEIAREPLPGHLNQVKRYLSSSILSHALVSGRDKEENAEGLWETDSFSIVGELVYFLPFSGPIFHSVELGKQEFQSVFQEQVVSGFYHAKHRADMRFSTNAMLRSVIHHITNASKKTASSQTPQQLRMDEFHSLALAPPQKIMSNIIARYYVPEYADRYDAIQIVGYSKKDGQDKPILSMHLDRLVKGISAGQIEASDDFDWGRGGKICCIMKDHKENTPSMSISFEGGGFHCFGCGAGGGFAEASIPKDLQDVVQINTRKKMSIEDVVISSRHQEIMTLAQVLLQKAFPDSRASRYLEKERKLNPERSYKNGAGYADKHLIINLLQAGFTYDELLYYGFLGISPKITEQGKIVRALQDTGLLIPQISRPVVMKEKGQPKREGVGYPYFILDEKVTYPLEVHGITNSFYGRSTRPDELKAYRHSKLLTKLSKMPHGAYNVSNAMKTNAEYLLLEEAPINADTFMQMTDMNIASALVGVDNDILFDFVAKFSGDIILSFNWDSSRIDAEGIERGMTGQKQTAKFLEKIREKGFKGKVYDFTSGFVEKNQGIVYNDMNGYWKEWRNTRGPISVFDSMKLIS